MDLTAFRQRINIKYFMAAYVGALLVFSAVWLGQPLWIAKGFAIVALYVLFDLAWTYLGDRVWYLPVSSWISGFILSVVAISDPSPLLIVLLPFLAVAAKHLLHLGKARHVFNPASFAMAAAAFFTPSISWWGVTWSTVSVGRVPLAIAVIVGLFILWRQARWHVAVPFLVSYGVLLGAFFLWMGNAFGELPMLLSPQLIDGTTIFFATVMLIEPITSTFPTRRQRAIYGALVGFFAVLMTYLSSVIPGIPALAAAPIAANLDPLVFGLLLGNLAASLAFLPSRRPVPAPARTPVPPPQPPSPSEAPSSPARSSPPS